MQSMSLDQAFRYLLDAPSIVKQIAPMAWTYVQAPQDGTLWLEWLPQEKSESGRLPSDGYAWADPEQAFRQDFGGYTIEMMVHTLGYRPQYDQMASHARTRYHFVAKNPSVNAAPPDPSLWIVHYHPTEQHRVLPSGQVPFTPQMRQMMNERRWLEGQGTLEKKDFMLHDRAQWPIIEVPRRGQQSMQGRPMGAPGMYGANAQQSQYPQYYPQQAGQQPQAKRQKMNTGMTGAAPDGVPDTSIEDEENTTLGDFFDHLTPRDISMTRYTQHHHWMEEVFSSPYASAQIVPTDLGLGLMGELKGLTDGILKPPDMEFAAEKPQPPKAKEAQRFSNLKKEQLEEFNKRVEKHLEEGQAEIARMKEAHARKMAEWKKSKTLMQAEERLRYATWEGHESAVPAFKLDDQATNGHAEGGAGNDTVEDVLRSVEENLAVKISSHKDATMIEKGGLEKEDRPRDPPNQPEQKPEQSSQHRPQQPVQQAKPPPNGGLPEAQMYHSDPTLGPIVNSRPQSMGQDATSTGFPSGPQQQQPAQQTQHQSYHPPQPPGQQSAGQTPMQMGDDSMMGGMDLDMNDANFDFNDTQSGIPGMQGPSGQTPGAVGTPGGQPQVQHQQPQPQPQSQTGTPGVGTGNGDNGMFHDSTFDDFTNMDDGTGGDDLVDFGTGGVGEESMFGDALHGMDAPEAGDGAEGGDLHGNVQ